MPRYLSVTFDDGLFEGAKKALRLLNRWHLPVCFYLVTDWVGSAGEQILDRCNANRDHGTWGEWRRIRSDGHEIGSHSASHMDALAWAARLRPWRLRGELQGSFDVLSRELGCPPVSLAMPYGHISCRSDALARRIYRSCRLNSGRPVYNDLSEIDWWRLAAWGPGADVPPGAMCRAIDETPDDHWLILNFHSLDDEGWMPISSLAFDELTRFIVGRRDLQVVTPCRMVASFANEH